MYTAQSAYEAIREYFSRPGAVIARKDDGYCQYRVNRNPNGPACAVGCLIPNDLYREDLEGYSLRGDWIDANWDNPDTNPALHAIFGDNWSPDTITNTPLYAFLAAAQQAHDDSCPDTTTLIARLDKIAVDQGLSLKVAA